MMGKVLEGSGLVFKQPGAETGCLYSLQPRCTLQTAEGIFPVFLAVPAHSWRNVLDVGVSC